MLPYFPFTDDVYKMTMGTQALKRGLVEIDDSCYLPEVQLKQELLTEDPDHYYAALADTEAMQWEAIKVVLPDMVRHYPDKFALTMDGEHWMWQNYLLNQEVSFEVGRSESLPLQPLDWLGRQVQEDLLLLRGSVAEGIPLVAGQLCFPNAWCLEDKIAQPFLTIHQEVPEFEQRLGRSSSLLLERLKDGRPVWRVNWAIKSLSRLNITPRFYHEVTQSYQELTCENAGVRCFLRVERQALVRLPETNAVLFTVHTYQEAIADIVARDPASAHLIARVLRTTPDEMLVYKGIAPFADTLLAYLEAR